MIAAVVLIIAWLVIGRETAADMIAQWTHNATYSHGWAVLPISAWLIWRRRDVLLAAPQRPSLTALTPLLLIGVTWAIARAAGVSVVEQFAWVVAIPCIVWAVCGVEMLRRLAFPLFFLLFLVPFGDGLVQPLMEFTADFTVWALQLTGIPVYREGMYFSIPSGNFEVAKACSGVRYLAASLMVGTLFAWLNFSSWRRRAVFMLAAVLVPIVANGLRAYGIVMIAHLSDQRLAVGVDHLVYGWLFFGIIIGALFWIAVRYGDRRVPADEGASPPLAAGSAGRASWPVIAGVVLALTASATSSAALKQRMAAGAHSTVTMTALPHAAAGWNGPLSSALAWQAADIGASAIHAGEYHGEGGPVGFAIAEFPPADEGEATAWRQRLFGEGAGDSFATTGVELAAPDARVSAMLLSGRVDGRRDAYLYWYEIDGRVTANPYVARWRETLALLQGSRAPARLVLAWASSSDEADPAVRLQAFASAHAGAILACTADAGAAGAVCERP